MHKAITAWLETFIISFIFITAGLLTNDPLSLQSSFPWIWFAPLLTALRYGIWPGLTSIGVIIIVAFYKDINILDQITFQLFILGGFLMTIFAASFQANWEKKNKNNQEISEYLSQRVQSIALAYKCCALAYATIEQNYILKPVTIRSAIMELRDLIANPNYPQTNVYDRLLNILSQQCSLERAGIFFIQDKKLTTTALVSIGDMQPINIKDNLIVACLEQNKITYINPKNIQNQNNILVVAPLNNAENNIYALLIIEELPFIKLTHENLEKLNLFLQYFLDGYPLKLARPILEKFPNCPHEFANEFQRLVFLYQKTQKDSALISLKITKSVRQHDYVVRLMQEKRGLDSLWKVTTGDTVVILVIMPLINYAGIEGYRSRINKILSEEFQFTLNANYVKFDAMQIADIKDPVRIINQILNA